MLCYRLSVPCHRHAQSATRRAEQRKPEGAGGAANHTVASQMHRLLTAFPPFPADSAGWKQVCRCHMRTQSHTVSSFYCRGVMAFFNLPRTTQPKIWKHFTTLCLGCRLWRNVLSSERTTCKKMLETTRNEARFTSNLIRRALL